MKQIQALIAAAAVALLAAACGGTSSHSSSNGGGSANASDLAYASCERSHGVPTFPDPTSTGWSKATLDQLAASNPQYSAASQTCAHLLPSGSGLDQAEVQQGWIGMTNFGRCMRSHGVPNWPGPTPYALNPSRAAINLPPGILPTPQVMSKLNLCLQLVPDNYVVGHILSPSPSWESVEQNMAAQ